MKKNTFNLISWTRDGKEVVCATTVASSQKAAEKTLRRFADMMCDGVWEVRLSQTQK